MECLNTENLRWAMDPTLLLEVSWRKHSGQRGDSTRILTQLQRPWQRTQPKSMLAAAWKGLSLSQWLMKWKCADNTLVNM